MGHGHRPLHCVLSVVCRHRRRLRPTHAAPGKTFVLNRVIDLLKEKYGSSFGSKVAVCASTGIAATHISGKILLRCRRLAAMPNCLLRCRQLATVLSCAPSCAEHGVWIWGLPPIHSPCPAVPAFP